MSAPSVRLVATDACVVLALGLIATRPFQDAYGGWRWALAAAGGLALGLIVAFTGLRFRLGPWPMALALLGVYLLVGPVLAVPDIAPAGFIPSPEALRALLSGLIDAWRDSLTLLTPLGSVGNVLIVPWVTGLVSGMLAGSILWRSRVLVSSLTRPMTSPFSDLKSRLENFSGRPISVNPRNLRLDCLLSILA